MTGRRWLVRLTQAGHPVGPRPQSRPTRLIVGHRTTSHPSPRAAVLPDGRLPGRLARASHPRCSSGPIRPPEKPPASSPMSRPARPTTSGPGLDWLVVGPAGGVAPPVGSRRATNRRRRLTIRRSWASPNNLATTRAPTRPCCSTKRTTPDQPGGGHPAFPARSGAPCQGQPLETPQRGPASSTRRQSSLQREASRHAPGASAVVVRRLPPLACWHRAIAARTWVCGWPPGWGSSS